MKKMYIGLAGFGTVGSGFYSIFASQKQFYQKKLGYDLGIKRVVAKSDTDFSEITDPNVQISHDLQDIVRDEQIAVVVELIGGTSFAKDFVISALHAGKSVISANKALIAEFGPELFCAAQVAKSKGKNPSLFFEAAVGGGMPVIKALRESMIGNEILSIKTIINGTCNYILTHMKQDQQDFEPVLQAAMENGFAEADPTLDIEGGDTGHKVAILASLAYGGYVAYPGFSVEGITKITQEDIQYTSELGYDIKLLGIIKRNQADGPVDVRVHPVMLPKGHILSSVQYEFNAVLLHGDAVGDILLYGKGAGKMPTASAVHSDLIDCVRELSGQSQPIDMSYYNDQHALSLVPIEDISCRYYLRFHLDDKPSVLGKIATIFGQNEISIASVVQKEQHSPSCVPVVFITDIAEERHIRKALEQIESLPELKEKPQVIRIEE